MAETFSELGLSDAVAAGAGNAGYERPTALQSAAVPVLRRGGNVLLHASSGAGVTAAFTLPLLDRIAEQRGEADTTAGPRALVLTPTPERAEAVAHGMAALAGDTGVAVRATVPGWRTQGADVLVTTPDQALKDVQSSSLKLESIVTLVVTQASDIYEMGGGDVLGTLVPLVPRDAQRVVATADLPAELEKFVEAHARRALTVPARPADPQQSPQQSAVGQIGYMVVTEAGKPEMLARLLEGSDEALIHARTAARAEQVLAELVTRGVTGPDGPRLRAAAFDADAGTSARIISYDVPFAADDLRRLHDTGGTVLVTAAELSHLRRIAAEVPFTLKHRRARDLDESPMAAFRDTVRAALRDEDLSSQMLLLEPLLDDHSAVEVAAALSALLRRRVPAAAPAPAGPAAAAATGAAPREAMTGEFTRLFVSIGLRDNIRPGDLVGAITGEAGIKGDQVGRVDIRDSFSVVEVAGDVAERVIRALNGTTMRGRSLRVDFDRKAGGGSGDRGREGGREGGRDGGRSGPRGREPERGRPSSRPPGRSA